MTQTPSGIDRPRPEGLADVADAVALSRSAAAAEISVPTDRSLAAYLGSYWQRVRGGETGSLPAVAGLVVLVLIFSALQPSFHSLGNLANIITQASSTIFIAMGLVFVLLLGEIDLAAGTAAGVCAAIMGRLSVGYGAPWPVAIAGALLAGLIIGILTGWLVAKIRIPSFVVTLALFLGFQGVTLFVVNNGRGTKGNLSITDPFLVNLVNGQLPPVVGWTLVVVVLVGYTAVKLFDVTRRQRAGLLSEPLTLVTIKVVVLAVVAALFVLLLNANRALNAGTPVIRNVGGKLVKEVPPALQGVPWVVPLIGAFFVLWTFVLSRTRYGRHVFAVGGNTEAARRAGIPVERIRISVFVINSFMAAIGGVLLASNVRAVDQGIGGGNTLLLAVGAAVIGGTSLFGGKGKPQDAIIGGLVVAVIANGMANLVKGNNSSAVQFIVTGAVLMLAAAVDALARRRAGARGLA